MLEAIGNLFASAAGGGLLGVLAQGAIGFLDIWRADKESARKIREMEATAKIRADEAAWRAFEASQKQAAPPPNVHSWAATVLTLFRPFLTLLFFGLAAFAFFKASAEARSETLGEIQTAAFGLAYWWFGSRYQQRMKGA